MKLVFGTLLIASCLLFTACEKKYSPARNQKVKPVQLGLYVENGKLMRNGKQYQGVGVNYFDAFYRVLKNTNDSSYVAGFEKLAKAKIPFARFMCGGFWPVEYNLYFKNKKAYFKLLDGVIKTAEKNHVGLIPSLFWHYATVPDLMKEPMDQLGNTNSKSIAFIKNYTKEIVTRYKDSPAIWGWELGNEYNLKIDLPNAADHRPWVWPNLGTATNRTERDELTSKQMNVVMRVFAETVRKYDKNRIISTGNAVPRWFAYHNSLNKSWGEDTVEQYKEILSRDNPNPCDVISVHIYPEKNNKYSGRAKSITELIKLSNELADSIGKPLFIGEFGVPNSYSNQMKNIYEEYISAIKKYKIPLAALWVYDFNSQNVEWNSTFENERAYMLEKISEINITNRLQHGNTK